MENIKSMKVHGCRIISINSRRMRSLEDCLNPNLLELHVPNLMTLGPYEEGPFDDFTSTNPPLPGISPAPSDTLLIAKNGILESVEFPLFDDDRGGFANHGKHLVAESWNAART
jgi:hypothetical protein